MKETEVTTSFGRVVDTGSGMDLPTGDGSVYTRSFSNKRYVKRQYLNGDKRVGAFFCESVRSAGTSSYIPTITLASDAYITPGKQTQSTSFGETVTIEMNQIRGSASDLRWRLNENIIEKWSGLDTVSIPYVTKADAGIYECYLNNRRSEAKHAIMRLIVRGCSESQWGPTCQNRCPTCYNGGVCDDVTGLCVCPPGFKGSNCGEGCGNNNWGLSCRNVCSSSNPGCPNVLMCVPDPIGCSCMAGYTGLGCTEGCKTGYYGSTCSEVCHCAPGVTCDPSRGCPNGPCETGYSGTNCQVHNVCPNGWHGELCRYHCHCTDNRPCDKDTGNCGSVGCKPPWTGNNCQLDGRKPTTVELIIPESNRGASITITCIVKANPIPPLGDIRVQKNDDVILENGVSMVSQSKNTRTVEFQDVSVEKGDVFNCQAFSSISGDADAKMGVTIYGITA
ncbi:uncharacterized protein [Antedon mediterranea]|uniref:uncharacterized protein n=1 Tax=Antedon mediterranea TaxID=105859 RepID=UPI003AF900E2